MCCGKEQFGADCHPLLPASPRCELQYEWYIGMGGMSQVPTAWPAASNIGTKSTFSPRLVKINTRMIRMLATDIYYSELYNV